MFDWILLLTINRLWYAIPLIVSASVVYAATRHEATRPILRQALRFGFWVSVFLLVVFLLIFGSSLIFEPGR